MLFSWCHFDPTSEKPRLIYSNGNSYHSSKCPPPRVKSRLAALPRLVEFDRTVKAPPRSRFWWWPKWPLPLLKLLFYKGLHSLLPPPALLTPALRVPIMGTRQKLALVVWVKIPVVISKMETTTFSPKPAYRVRQC